MAFFNDFKELFASAAQSVSSKTRDGVETARLAGESRSVSNDLTELYTQIGRSYVDSRGGDTDALLPLMERALDLREKLEALERQRMQLRSQNRCPACGAAMPKDARFCSNCGRRMPEEAPETEPAPAAQDVHYCPECGAMQKENEKFCAVCGFGGKQEKEPELPEEFVVKMVRPAPPAADEGDEAPDNFEAE